MLSYIGLPSLLSFLFTISFYLLFLPHSPFLYGFFHFMCFVSPPGPLPPSLCSHFFPCLSFSPAVGSDLKDIQNNKNRYLISSENQRPGHFSTAPIGSLTASPSSGSLCSQVGLQSVTSIQERIMSTPGGEEAIERLKVRFIWGESVQ